MDRPRLPAGQMGRARPRVLRAQVPSEEAAGPGPSPSWSARPPEPPSKGLKGRLSPASVKPKCSQPLGGSRGAQVSSQQHRDGPRLPPVTSHFPPPPLPLRHLGLSYAFWLPWPGAPLPYHLSPAASVPSQTTGVQRRSCLRHGTAMTSHRNARPRQVPDCGDRQTASPKTHLPSAQRL